MEQPVQRSPPWRNRWCWPDSQRWIPVVVLLLAILALAEVCQTARAWTSPWGLRGHLMGDRLVIDAVRPGSLAWSVWVEPGDIVVAIDGWPVHEGVVPATIEAAGELTLRRASSGEIDTLSRAERLWVASDGTRQSLGMEDPNGVLRAVAALYYLIAAIVFLLANDRRPALVLLVLGVTAAIILITVPLQLAGHLWADVVVTSGVPVFALAVLIFFLVFPVDRLGTPWRRRALVLWALVHALVVGVRAWSKFVLWDQSPALGEGLRAAGVLVFLVDFLAAVILSVWAVFAGPRVARPPHAWIASGVVCALVPLIILLVLSLHQQAAPSVSASAAATAGLPIGLGLAVLSRQSFGVNRLVRRALVAWAVWIALLGGYGVTSAAIARAVGGAGLIIGGWVTAVVAVGVVAGTFPPLQSRLRRAIERALFRDTYDVVGTLERLGVELAQLTDEGEIAALVLVRLGATLDLEWAVLTVALSGEEFRAYTWPDGRGPVSPAASAGYPRGGAAVLVVPLRVDTGPIGELVLGPKRRDIELLADDRKLVETLGPLLAKALRIAALLRQLREQAVDLAHLSRHLMQAQEEERRRLALDLHDDSLQRLRVLARQLHEVADANAHVGAWRAALEEVEGALRAICTDLRPASLADGGLRHGLQHLVYDLQARSDLAVELIDESPPACVGRRLDRDLETALYRLAQEALNNCLKHARATRVIVTLRQEASEVSVEVADNGRGFAAAREEEGRRFPIGLVGMRERVQPWGGTVGHGPRPGGGALVRATVPLAASLQPGVSPGARLEVAAVGADGAQSGGSDGVAGPGAPPWRRVDGVPGVAGGVQGR